MPLQDPPCIPHSRSFQYAKQICRRIVEELAVRLIHLRLTTQHIQQRQHHLSNIRWCRTGRAQRLINIGCRQHPPGSSDLSYFRRRQNFSASSTYSILQIRIKRSRCVISSTSDFVRYPKPFNVTASSSISEEILCACSRRKY